ncbi:MAG: hypothetical protein AAF657_23095, partial [Acidobacteriota bacterium]
SAYGTVKVRLRLTPPSFVSESVADGHLYFFLPGQTAASPTRRVGFQVPIDGAFHTVTLDAGSHPEWGAGQPITKLRLDPILNPGGIWAGTEVVLQELVTEP